MYCEYVTLNIKKKDPSLSLTPRVSLLMLTLIHSVFRRVFTKYYHTLILLTIFVPIDLNIFYS